MNLEQLLAHLKRLAASLSAKQLVTLGAVFVLVVGLVTGSAYWINTPNYSLLFADMDAEAANSVVTRLKNDKVAYVLDDGGHSVRVASDRVDELRLQFAGTGMPSSGRIGFEIFDRTAFGTTEFLEHVNYRRALEGELARTISTISDVASARVHIAMAKDSLFANDTQPAKASVVLKLRNNRPLAQPTVAAITGLVAASVESLRPESVVVMDTFGRPLSNQSDDEVSGLQLDKQHRVEKDLSAKVVSLLEPVVGSGRVHVNVAVRLNGDSEEETEERWDPTTVVRSKQISSDSGGMMSSGGVAGARANSPQGTSTSSATPGAPVGTPLVASRTNETTNYEVSRLTRHRVVPRGQIARLNVAVIVDDEKTATKGPKGETQMTSKPRSQKDLERLQNLVAVSVGVDTDRGDQVTVENIAFEVPVEEPIAAPKWWEKVIPQQSTKMVNATGVFELVRLLAIIGLAALAFLVVLKPMTQRAFAMPQPVAITAGAPAGAMRAAKTVQDLEGEIEAEIEAGLAAKGQEMRRLPVLTKRIAKITEEQPEHVAKLVRSLLTDEER